MRKSRKVGLGLPLMAIAGMSLMALIYVQAATPSDQSEPSWMSGGPMKITIIGRNVDLQQVLSMRMGGAGQREGGMGGQSWGSPQGQGTSGRQSGQARITEIQGGGGAGGGAGGMGGTAGGMSQGGAGNPAPGTGGTTGGVTGGGTTGNGNTAGNQGGATGNTGTGNTGTGNTGTGNTGTGNTGTGNTGTGNTGTTDQGTTGGGTTNQGTTNQQRTITREQTIQRGTTGDLNEGENEGGQTGSPRNYVPPQEQRVAYNESGSMGGSSKMGGMPMGTMGQRENALEVVRAMDENGKEIPGLNGQIVYYLQTDKSRDLIMGHANEGVMVKGTLFPKEQVLQVDSFKPAPMAGEIRVTLEGRNLNLCTAIKKEGASNATCDRFPQTVLHVTKVVNQGGAMMEGGMGGADMTGWYLHYVRNNQSQQLTTMHQDHLVQVTGTVFPDKKLMLVTNVKHLAGPEGSENKEGAGREGQREQ